MLREHRFRQIEEALLQQPFLEVRDLADSLRVSEATVRRDLEALHVAGRIERTRGGAMSRETGEIAEKNKDGTTASTRAAKDAKAAPQDVREESLTHVSSFTQRMHLGASAKSRIGAAAANLIKDGQSIMLAGGTTTYAAAHFLRGRRVSVVTNSLPAAGLLGETLGVDVLVTGGMVYPKHDILIGPQLKQTLESVHAADWLLLGAGGASADGFFDSNHWEVEAQRELMARAERVALLIDAAKFERLDMVFVAKWEEIQVLVTDAPPPKAVKAALQKAGVKLIVAKEKAA